MKLLNYFKYSWTFFENAKVKFIGYIFLRLFSMLLSLTSPLLYAVLITYITQKNQKWAIIVLCFSTGVQFLAILVNYFLGLLESKVKREVTCNAQKRLMSKLLSIPPFLLKDFQDGNLLGIISRDANCPVVFIFALLNGLYNIITVIIIGIVVFILSWQLSVALLLTYPIIYIINFIFGKKLGKKQKEMLHRADGLLAYLKNSISELTFIKENNGEDKTIIGFDKNVFWANKTSFEMEKLKLRNGLCIQTVGVLNYVLLNSIGIILVISNKMLFSNYIAFNGYSSRFGKALTGIVSLNSALQPSFVVLDRLMDIERISLEVEEKRKFKKKLHVGKNIKIKVENLSICLSNQVIFKDVSFEINEGEIIQICGRNGCGKTTILKTIMQEYEIYKGKITINDLDVFSIDYKDIQENICYLRQHSPLLPLSIIDNITLFSDEIPLERVIEVCKIVDLWEDLIKLPCGLNTIIDDKISLSSGQIQKLQIARALLKNAPIILMDEITANLDSKTTEIIRNVCLRMRDEGKLIIYISHNLKEEQFSNRKFVFN